MSGMGREKYAGTTGRFRESKAHRPLSGDEFEEVTVASRPSADVDLSQIDCQHEVAKQPLPKPE